MLLGFVLAFAALAGHPASAACTDPPRPNVNWERCYMEQRNFSASDLSGARLRDARFNRSNLDDSNLSAVDAHRAKFISASMSNIVFDNAHLTESDFTKADLHGASFARADLRRTRLFRANLRGANFFGARMTGADFLKADLSGATWVDGKTVCAEGSIGQCK
jgi:uncharacterized protein YjbI with pentapeptide repeats